MYNRIIEGKMKTSDGGFTPKNVVGIIMIAVIFGSVIFTLLFR